MAEKLFDKKRAKNDLILIAVVFISAVIVFLLISISKQKGDIVLVKVNGKAEQQYSLSENIDTVIYTGENGEMQNRLIIKDEKVYISEANCPDKICVGHRAIENANEAIVCLPHKLVVEIVSDISGEPDMVV